MKVEEEVQPATGKAVIDFLTSAATKGDMNSATAAAMRAAVKEVMESVEGENWESVDVSQLDLERHGKRFATKRANDYKAASLRVYQSRFRNAVTMFLTWRKDPAAWKYTPDRPYADRKKKQQKQDTNGSNGNQHGSLIPPGVDMVEYPFVVRPGVRAKLTVPADLRGPEAARLQAFIGTLPMEERPALPAATDPEQS